jgi:hypothetical protein
MDDNSTSFTAMIFAVVIMLAVCWLICTFGTYLVCICLGIDWVMSYGTALFVSLLTIKSVLILMK